MSSCEPLFKKLENSGNRILTRLLVTRRSASRRIASRVSRKSFQAQLVTLRIRSKVLFYLNAQSFRLLRLSITTLATRLRRYQRAFIISTRHAVGSSCSTCKIGLRLYRVGTLGKSHTKADSHKMGHWCLQLPSVQCCCW